MNKRKYYLIIKIFLSLTTFLFLACACQTKSTPTQDQEGPLRIMAVENFLADISQNITGNQIPVESLIPYGLDPHAFEPTPQDAARIANAQVLIINGAGLEEWLQSILNNAGGERLVIEASTDLTSRPLVQGEELHAGKDPHFWLDPIMVIKYTENIRDGLIQADPLNEAVYTRNAEDYISKLGDLDVWIQDQVKQIPPDDRLLITNHESFGYFADRYGFKIIGTIIPSVSTGASPSAQQLAQLIDRIKSLHVRAVFLETGTNPQLAEQIGKETGIKVITGLYSHSITLPDGVAPSYIDMMKYNALTIVEALKE